MMPLSIWKKKISKKHFADIFRQSKASAAQTYGFQSASGKISEAPIHWTSPTGTGQAYKIWQRTDIDWSHVRTDGLKAFRGKTNLEAARAGYAPQLSDGSMATLHHINQNGLGNLVEASRRYHGVGKPGQDILHGLYGRGKAHPTNPVNRPLFDQDFSSYWKQRITEIR